MRVAGFTSTGSKRPEALFGTEWEGMPLRMLRSAGCLVTAEDGREYLDFIMALGAVALGYGHPAVTRAVLDAAERGAIGSLAPVEEESLANELSALFPGIEQLRFLKTGAEAVAAAVRLARAATGREQVMGCGYHGWLDWCRHDRGVPDAVQSLFTELPFNDPERTRTLLCKAGDRLACVVIEPVVEAAPSQDWLRTVREETLRVGAVLVFDEIKTGFRVSLGGAAARWGGDPDLIVLGKALANGYPLAAVGGPGKLMSQTPETWISSTMATEFVSFAAARAVVHVAKETDLPARLGETGGRLFTGLAELARRYAHRIERLGGIPEMCYLRFASEEFSGQVARACARRGVLFKRSAYNFVSLAHGAAEVARALATLEEVLADS